MQALKRRPCASSGLSWSERKPRLQKLDVSKRGLMEVTRPGESKQEERAALCVSKLIKKKALTRARLELECLCVCSGRLRRVPGNPDRCTKCDHVRIEG